MLRNIPKEDAVVLNEIYLNYTNKFHLEGNRLLDPADSAFAKASSDAAKILQRHFRQQESTDATLIATAEKLRSSYLRRLNTMQKALEEKGLTSQIEPIKKEILAIGSDGNNFLKRFELTL